MLYKNRRFGSPFPRSNLAAQKKSRPSSFSTFLLSFVTNQSGREGNGGKKKKSKSLLPLPPSLPSFFFSIRTQKKWEKGEKMAPGETERERGRGEEELSITRWEKKTRINFWWRSHPPTDVDGIQYSRTPTSEGHNFGSPAVQIEVPLYSWNFQVVHV